MPFLKRTNKPTLHYEIDDFTDPWKKAPTMILQHGFGRSAELWYPWIPYLSRHFRIVRPDIRGLGQSPMDFDLATGMTADHFVSDLVDMIEHVDDRPVHYCGESLGGMLGAVLSVKHPEKLRTLTMIAAPLRISKATQHAFACGHASWQDAIRELGSQRWAHEINGSLRFPSDSDQGMQTWYADMMGKTHPEALIALSNLAKATDIEALLGRITTPTLGLYPSGGTITGPDEQILREKIPGIRYVSLPSKYHAIQFLLAKSCANEVLHFANQFDGVSSYE